MGKQETLETIWEVPDELWERIDQAATEEEPQHLERRTFHAARLGNSVSKIWLTRDLAGGPPRIAVTWSYIQ